MFFVISWWYFWCLVQFCLIFTWKIFYAAAPVSPYFSGRDFGSWFLVSVSRFPNAFQLFILIFFQHECHHFLKVIILVQFFGIFVLQFICLNSCQVSKCFISPKRCIVNVTSCFSYFSRGDFDTLLKSLCNYLMRSYF